MRQLRIILFAIALVFSFGLQNASAQSKNKSKAEDPIKTSGAYFWGESSNTSNQNEARQQALDNLIENIKDNYKSQAYLFPEIKEKHKDLIFKSFATELDEISVSEYTDSENTVLMRYIKKTEFDSLCEDRKNQIFNAIQKGIENENKLSTGDALRSYYKALMLCYSHPKGKALKFRTDDDVEHHVISWLVEDKIDGDDGILKNINVVVKSWIEYRDHSDANIVIFNNYKLSNIRFNYFDPIKHKNINYNIENGDATLQLAKGTNESYIKIDFSYPDFKTSDPAAYFMNENLMDEIVFHKSTYSIKKPKNEDIVIIADMPNDNDITNYLTGTIFQVGQKNMSECLAIMEKVQEAIDVQDVDRISQYFADDSFEKFKQLLGYDDNSEDRPFCKITDDKIDYCFVMFNNEIICRSIPIQFEYSNGLTYNRSIVFRLNKYDKKINSFAIKLTPSVENYILSNNDCDEEKRLKLIYFLEDYQTAYATKNIAYFEKVLPDDALIIIERFTTKQSIPERITIYDDVKSDTIYSYKKYEKVFFIQNINRAFKHTMMVNTKFNDIIVEHSSKEDNMFGISMTQEYTNNNYIDNGYLFLYVDLKTEPSIKIRAWQPEKTTHKRFSISNFDKKTNQ